MIFKKLSCVILLSNLCLPVLSMQIPQIFNFIARVQNQSRSTISYIHAKGDFPSDYKEEATLSQAIHHDNSLEIVRGKGKSPDMWLEIAGQRYTLSNIATVFEKVGAGTDKKTAHKGYQIKFDGENVAQVAEGELVCVKIGEENKISFEVQRDLNYYLIANN